MAFDTRRHLPISVGVLIERSEPYLPFDLSNRGSSGICFYEKRSNDNRWPWLLEPVYPRTMIVGRPGMSWSREIAGCKSHRLCR